MSVASVAASVRQDLGNPGDGNKVAEGQQSKYTQGEDPFGRSASVALSQSQSMCEMILSSSVVEGALTLFILISLVLVIVEADSGGSPPQWLKVTNLILIVFYSIEAAAKIYVMRSRYFYQARNLFDISLITLDIVSEALEAVHIDAFPSFMMLRTLRVFRLARAVKVLVKFPQLAVLLTGLANSLSLVAFGILFLILALVFWGVCAVYFIQPVNLRVSLTDKYADCERCGRAFETVFQATLTFSQQILAGDSWGQVTIPIIDEEPWTAAFFAVVFVSIHLTILNVLLGVIVDTSLKASNDVTNMIVKMKAAEFDMAERELKAICRTMDEDGSGDLTVDELVEGFDGNERFRNMMLAMDIKKTDLAVVFSILDTDESGSVNYDEFITELFKMKTRDSHTLLVFIKHYVTEIRRDVREQIRVLKNEVMAKMATIEHEHVDPEAAPDGAAGALGEAARGAEAERARVEEKERELGRALPMQEGTSRCLWEELRDLRTVISDDLMRSMREISHKSESHTRLLASIAGDTSLLVGGGAFAPSALQLSSVDGGSRRGSPTDNGLPRSDSHLKVSPLVLCRVGQSDGAGIDSSSQMPSRVQPRLASAWGMRSCCGVQKDTSSTIERPER